jgi:hypothetical protein
VLCLHQSSVNLNSGPSVAHLAGSRCTDSATAAQYPFNTDNGGGGDDDDDDEEDISRSLVYEAQSRVVSVGSIRVQAVGFREQDAAPPPSQTFPIMLVAIVYKRQK